MWKKGAPPPVVLSHSARLNAKKFARVTDETHPAESSVGPLAITTFPVITAQVSETDFHATSAAIGRATSPRGPQLLTSRRKAGNAHRPFIVRTSYFQPRRILACRIFQPCRILTRRIIAQHRGAENCKKLCEN